MFSVTYIRRKSHLHIEVGFYYHCVRLIITFP